MFMFVLFVCLFSAKTNLPHLPDDVNVNFGLILKKSMLLQCKHLTHALIHNVVFLLSLFFIYIFYIILSSDWLRFCHR